LIFINDFYAILKAFLHNIRIIDGLARDSSKYFLKLKIIFTLENALIKDICVVQTTTIATFAELKANTSLPTTY